MGQGNTWAGAPNIKVGLDVPVVSGTPTHFQTQLRPLSRQKMGENIYPCRGKNIIMIYAFRQARTPFQTRIFAFPKFSDETYPRSRPTLKVRHARNQKVLS